LWWLPSRRIRPETNRMPAKVDHVANTPPSESLSCFPPGLFMSKSPQDDQIHLDNLFFWEYNPNCAQQNTTTL
jgi:hypothetical protein